MIKSHVGNLLQLSLKLEFQSLFSVLFLAVYDMGAFVFMQLLNKIIITKIIIFLFIDFHITLLSTFPSGSYRS